VVVLKQAAGGGSRNPKIQAIKEDLQSTQEKLVKLRNQTFSPPSAHKSSGQASAAGAGQNQHSAKTNSKQSGAATSAAAVTTHL
jgi:hypothetical protein